MWGICLVKKLVKIVYASESIHGCMEEQADEVAPQ